MTTVLGFETVNYTDQDRNETVALTVRQIPIRDLPRYFEASLNQDEAALVEILCGKPKGWADTLPLKVCEDVLEAGERLNGEHLKKYAARLKARQEKLMPGVQEKFMERVVEQVASRFQSGSPESPTKPA